MIYKKAYLYNDEETLLEILVRIHLVFKKIYVQEKYLKILTYFCKYGITEEASKKIIADKVVPTRQTIHNAKTALKKLNLIEKVKENDWKVIPPLDGVNVTDTLNFSVLCKKIQ